MNLSFAPPKRILCATDLSEPADEALRQANAWARRHGAEFMVVHVIPDLVRSHLLFPQRHQSSTEELPQLVGEVGRLLAERITAVTGRGASEFHARVEVGHPYALITKSAERENVDLVVVAGRGASGLERVMLGSVAEQVVRYAPCPVLVARPSATTGQILAATDFSDRSLPALAAAAMETKARGAHMTAFHAVETETTMVGLELGFGAGGVMPAVAELEKARSAVADKQLAAALVNLGTDGEKRVGRGEPATALLRLADELPAELIVIGTHGRTGLRRLLLGSVAERVVRAAEVSVLAVRLATK